MKFLLCLLVPICSVLVMGTKYIDVDESEDDDTSKVMYVKGGLRGYFAMTAALDYDGKNMVCSPISALLPLGKLAIGAEGRALYELVASIGVVSEKFKAHFTKLIEDLKYLPNVQLDIASRIYLSKTASVQKKFTDRARDIFESSVEKVDFENPNDAAHRINEWVKRKTNGRITDMISPSEISPDSSLVLVNAIYFSGRWKNAFEKVKSGSFYTPTGEKVILMMKRYGWYNYARSKALGAQLVEIPYEGDGASFIILLPNKRNGLPALLRQLKIAPELLDLELRKMQKVRIVLTLPKFKMETTLDLKDLYRKIGLKNIFETENSGLTGIIWNQSMYVSNAKQKAFIEVNELGTEAAASSVVEAIAVSLDIHREIVNCDHPFLFYVKVRKQQLFAGTVNYL